LREREDFHETPEAYPEAAGADEPRPADEQAERHRRVDFGEHPGEVRELLEVDQGEVFVIHGGNLEHVVEAGGDPKGHRVVAGGVRRHL